MSARCCCCPRLHSKASRQPLTLTSGSKTPLRKLHSSARCDVESPATTKSAREPRYSGVQIDDNATVLRQKMFAWLHGPGRRLRQPLQGSTNYLGAYNARGDLIRQSDGPTTADTPGSPATEGESVQDVESNKARGEHGAAKLPPETVEDLRPYPLNRHFRSQPVLSEPFREEIWRRVALEGQDIRLVSSGMGVSLERVAAVVRMKQVEKRWLQEGKPLATPYSKAVLAMLPTTPFDPNTAVVGHESINDLQVVPQTKVQLFQPVPESRSFTRRDAGQAFDEALLPADERIPHPELVQTEKDRLSGMSEDEQGERAAERMRKAGEIQQRKLERRRQRQVRDTKVVSAGRWDFMFREVNAEAVGKDGRSESAVGWRYGVPHQDRKKGQVKIPTQVL